MTYAADWKQYIASFKLYVETVCLHHFPLVQPSPKGVASTSSGVTMECVSLATGSVTNLQTVTMIRMNFVVRIRENQCL